MTSYSFTEAKEQLSQLIHSNQIVEIQDQDKNTSAVLLSKMKWEATNSLLEEMERQLAIKEMEEARAKSKKTYSGEEVEKMLKEAGIGGLA